MARTKQTWTRAAHRAGRFLDLTGRAHQLRKDHARDKLHVVHPAKMADVEVDLEVALPVVSAGRKLRIVSLELVVAILGATVAAEDLVRALDELRVLLRFLGVERAPANAALRCRAARARRRRIW